MALLFNLIFMVRRLIIAFIIVGLPRWSWFQVQVITNLNIFSLIYQGWYRPYSRPVFNYKELTNEFFIQLNTYYLIVYSEFVINAETRYTMGWANIGCLAIMILFNLTLICKWQFEDAKRWLRWVVAVGCQHSPPNYFLAGRAIELVVSGESGGVQPLPIPLVTMRSTELVCSIPCMRSPRASWRNRCCQFF